MSLIYQENKNLINKYKSALESYNRRIGIHQIESQVPFNINGKEYKVPIALDLKAQDKVIIEEVGKKFYFCIKLTQVKRYLVSSFTDQSDMDALAYKVFIKSLGRYSTSKDEVLALIKHLNSVGVKNDAKGNPFSEEIYYFVSELRRNDDYYKKAFKDYPDVKEIKGYLEKLKPADVDLSRVKYIYKSIKDKELIPVSNLDSEYGILYVPEYSPSSRTSTNFYMKVDISRASDVSGKALQKYSGKSLSYTPYSYWVVPTYNCSFIDQNRYFKINYEA